MACGFQSPQRHTTAQQTPPAPFPLASPTLLESPHLRTFLRECCMLHTLDMATWQHFHPHRPHLRTLVPGVALYGNPWQSPPEMGTNHGNIGAA
jgi:hypothetical protein